MKNVPCCIFMGDFNSTFRSLDVEEAQSTNCSPHPHPAHTDSSIPLSFCGHQKSDFSDSNTLDSIKGYASCHIHPDQPPLYSSPLRLVTFCNAAAILLQFIQFKPFFPILLVIISLACTAPHFSNTVPDHHTLPQTRRSYITS